VSPVRRVLLVGAAATMLLLLFTGIAGAQSAYPPDVGAGGANHGPAAGANAAAGGAGSQLAFTGSNHDTVFLVAGVGAVLLGGTFVVLSRRRRSVDPS